MIIFTDEKGCIKDVGKTSDTSLIPIEITDGTFDGWSTAKICCYKVTVVDGIVTMRTPYVDSKLLDTVDIIGKEVDAITPYTETKTAYIDDTEVVFEDLPSGAYNVSFNKSVMAKKVSKEDFTDGTSTITIEFEPLEEVTEVTISIV